MSKECKINFKKRFEDFAYAPLTDAGNPLYRKSPEYEKGEFTQEQLADEEFESATNKCFTSPKNVRALFIGVNKALVVNHRGFAHITGKDKNGEITSELGTVRYKYINKKNDEKIKLVLKKDQETLLCAKRKGQNDKGQPIYDIENIEIVKNVEKAPLSALATNNNYVLSNIEEIYFDVNGIVNHDQIIQFLTSQDTTAFKEFIKDCLSTTDSPIDKRFPRLQRVGLVKGLDDFLQCNEKIHTSGKNNENTIETRLQNEFGLIGDGLDWKYTAYNEEKQQEETKKCQKVIIGYEVIGDDFSIATKEWLYDKHLLKYKKDRNNKKNTAVSEKENNNENETNYKFMNDYFMKYWERQGKKIVVKKKDYTVKAELCAKENGAYKKYFNLFEDYYFEGADNKLLITGVMGEQYLCGWKKIIDSYTYDNNGKQEDITKEVLANIKNGSIICQPKDNGAKYAMYFVPVENNNFAIRLNEHILKINVEKNQRGEYVAHDKGDYVLCRLDENGKPILDQQKVINGSIFNTLYEKYDENANRVDERLQKIIDIIKNKEKEKASESDIIAIAKNTMIIQFNLLDNNIRTTAKEMIINTPDIKEKYKKELLIAIKKINGEEK